MSSVKKENIYAVILAGGQGTRFWPLSRKDKPKQFLNIFGKKSLFQKTVSRLQPFVFAENIFVITNARYKKIVLMQMKEIGISSPRLLLEPIGKNTAPAICWAAFRIERINPKATMVVLPADHLILNKKVFIDSLKDAVAKAQEGFLVTLGIIPTRPETGYGYLKVAKKSLSKYVFKVERFIEKPPLKKAEHFFKTKRYFWNSGIFIWKVAVILEAFMKFQPKIYNLLKSERDIAKNWNKLPGISIDYGILEKSDKIISVSRAKMGWSDLGSLDALTEVSEEIRKGHSPESQAIHLESQGVSVFGGSRFVATIGLKDAIIVDTPDALLVCAKKKSQDVKRVVEQLKKRNSNIL